MSMVQGELTVLSARRTRADMMRHGLRHIEAAISSKPQTKTKIHIFHIAEEIFVEPSASA